MNPPYLGPKALGSNRGDNPPPALGSPPTLLQEGMESVHLCLDPPRVEHTLGRDPSPCVCVCGGVLLHASPCLDLLNQVSLGSHDPLFPPCGDPDGVGDRRRRRRAQWDHLCCRQHLEPRPHARHAHIHTQARPLAHSPRADPARGPAPAPAGGPSGAGGPGAQPAGVAGGRRQRLRADLIFPQSGRPRAGAPAEEVALAAASQPRRRPRRDPASGGAIPALGAPRCPRPAAPAARAPTPLSPSPAPSPPPPRPHAPRPGRVTATPRAPLCLAPLTPPAPRGVTRAPLLSAAPALRPFPLSLPTPPRRAALLLPLRPAPSPELGERPGLQSPEEA
jgi:hypothetical protein